MWPGQLDRQVHARNITTTSAYRSQLTFCLTGPQHNLCNQSVLKPRDQILSLTDVVQGKGTPFKCIRCDGQASRTPLYAVAGMSQTELVAMLRSKARKSGTQTSHYRGVSLLKQTGKWHAQINVGGKQV